MLFDRARLGLVRVRLESGFESVSFRVRARVMVRVRVNLSAPFDDTERQPRNSPRLSRSLRIDDSASEDSSIRHRA